MAVLAMKRALHSQGTLRSLPPPALPRLDLRLYVADATPLSLLALENVKEICKEYLVGRFHLKVIDVARSPLLARKAGVVATPLLERRQPESVRRLIGAMTDTGRVLAWLWIRS